MGGTCEGFMWMRNEQRHLTWALSLIGVILLATPSTGAVTLYVSTSGNDAWSGQLPSPSADKTDGPLSSLERARDVIRKMSRAGGLPKGGIEVIIRQGNYYLAQAFELNREDSGTAEAPIVYRGYPGEQARLIGGKAITSFRPITDPDILDQLDDSARNKIVQADLRELGINEYGASSGGALELFFKNKPMPISRWPNEEFARMLDALGPTPLDVRGTKGTVEGIFAYGGDRPKRWKKEKEIWLHGYWFWDWADERERVKSIDTEKRIIQTDPPYHAYGYRKGQGYYAFNLLSEIDRPGEWCLDRETGVLYFWPPTAIEQGQAIVSVLPVLLKIQDCSHVSFVGLTLEAARGTAAVVSGGTKACLRSCMIRNVGDMAVSVSGGSENRIVGCDIYQCGGSGISLTGGDRESLTPGGHLAENNHIYEYGRLQRTYSPGIALHGVGNRAYHNLIHDAPHQAIAFSGNDHRIEFNEIHSVCYESNDAGAIYAGRDWTMRGNVIKNNYLHDISGLGGRGCMGVYLDDMFSGTEISSNVFCRVTSAVFIGGGRDNTIANNIFIDCRPAVHVDSRALGWARPYPEQWAREAQEEGTISGIHYLAPPYSERYPRLASILADDPAAPKGNNIARNICFGGEWDHIEADRQFITGQDNLVSPKGDFDRGSKEPIFTLKPTSPAIKYGFKPIPAEKIGLFQDEHRASWPVQHRVRQVAPLPIPPMP